MKRMMALAFIVFLSFGFILNKILEQNARDIIKKLDITNETANDYIWSNCSGKLFYFPSPKDLKNIAMGERASIVRAIGNYVKEYSRSEEFLNKYRAYKEAGKPEPPKPPQSGNEMKQEQKAAYLKSIEEMEKTKKSMPADQQAAFDDAINTMKEQLKELENPANDETYKQMDIMMKEGYEQQKQEYVQQIEQWEKEYPDNPKLMIKAWLTAFLENTEDVDFSAELKKNEYGQKIFVNPDYEKKNYLWKLCFRSGKETLAAGRSFASQWLKELK